ncbi:hypothetical protein ScPMuIL_018852 [Solemya velum]
MQGSPTRSILVPENSNTETKRPSEIQQLRADQPSCAAAFQIPNLKEHWETSLSIQSRVNSVWGDRTTASKNFPYDSVNLCEVYITVVAYKKSCHFRS